MFILGMMSLHVYICTLYTARKSQANFFSSKNTALNDAMPSSIPAALAECTTFEGVYKQ